MEQVGIPSRYNTSTYPPPSLKKPMTLIFPAVFLNGELSEVSPKVPVDINTKPRKKQGPCRVDQFLEVFFGIFFRDWTFSAHPFSFISSMKLTDGKTSLPKRLQPVMCAAVPRAIP